MTDTAPHDAWPKSKQQSLSNFGYMTYDGLVDRVQHVRKISEVCFALVCMLFFDVGGLFHIISLLSTAQFLHIIFKSPRIWEADFRQPSKNIYIVITIVVIMFDPYSSGFQF